MKGQLSVLDMRHIEEILMDPVLLSVLQMDGEKARYVLVTVDGNITIGRTRHYWLNWMFQDTKRISFTDFAFKVANALAGQVNNRNEVIFEGISRTILDKAIKDNDLHYVVDALFDTMRLGWDGINTSRFTKMGPANEQRNQRSSNQVNSSSYVGNIYLNSNEVFGKVIVERRLYNSIN